MSHTQPHGNQKSTTRSSQANSATSGNKKPGKSGSTNVGSRNDHQGNKSTADNQRDDSGRREGNSAASGRGNQGSAQGSYQGSDKQDRTQDHKQDDDGGSESTGQDPRTR